MRQRPSDLLIYALLLLVTTATVGMLLADWRLVLYPTLLAAGVLVALSRPARDRRIAVALPAGVSVLLLACYGALDAMSVSDPRATGLVFGFAPTTALYLFGIAPVLLLVGLAYALTFSTDDTEGTVE
ncbi:hypothetical protein [Halostreptopolyspora alba]|uniref:Uncharacterized protein n=1 Tax=Halostreptopolyspora alba TaxID=2487137 RepID=A0A3N0DY95_9ACTN|nr:hypothetical protein EFW17_22870 [Nocardiopsaceae bacterium YIM 96095]